MKSPLDHNVSTLKVHKVSIKGYSYRKDRVKQSAERNCPLTPQNRSVFAPVIRTTLHHSSLLLAKAGPIETNRRAQIPTWPDYFRNRLFSPLQTHSIPLHLRFPFHVNHPKVHTRVTPSRTSSSTTDETTPQQTTRKIFHCGRELLHPTNERRMSG